MADYDGETDIYATEYFDDDESAGCLTFGGEREKLIGNEPDVKSVFGKAEYPRLVSREGETNFTLKDKRSRFVCSQTGFLFHIIIAMPIWKMVFWFIATYIMAYFFFGTIIFIIQESAKASGKAPYRGIDNYWDAVVFIGYTMTTVGFGNQYPNDSEASIMPLFAVVVGLLLDAFWLGIIFARISSPRPLRHTVLFSKYAILRPTSDIEASPMLACRATNLRAHYAWVDLTISASLVTWDPARKEMRFRKLELFDDATPFMDLPWMMRHQVDLESPLYPFLKAPEDFEEQRGEIILELNGQDPLTGSCMKKRFSYVANEIFRGHDFVDILSDGPDGYEVDLTRFHEIKPCIPPQGSNPAPPTKGYGAAAGGTPATQQQGSSDAIGKETEQSMGHGADATQGHETSLKDPTTS